MIFSGLLFLMALPVFSQSHPFPGKWAEWTYLHVSFDGVYVDRAEDFYYALGDPVVLNRRQYAQVYSPVSPGNRLVREDTAARKVYVRYDKNYCTALKDTELLLFDFSLQAGDSIRLNFKDTACYFKVTKIGQDSTLTHEYRKTIQLQDAHGTAFMNWMEGVGPLHNYLFYNEMRLRDLSLFNFEAYTEVICFKDDQVELLSQRIYVPQRAVYNGCQGIILGVKEGEKTEEASVRLLPDPVTETSRFYYRVPASVQVAVLNVYTVQGLLVQSIRLAQGAGDIPFSIPGLSKGLYLYNLVLDGVAAGMRKMVVVR